MFSHAFEALPIFGWNHISYVEDRVRSELRHRSHCVTWFATNTTLSYVNDIIRHVLQKHLNTNHTIAEYAEQLE